MSSTNQQPGAPGTSHEEAGDGIQIPSVAVEVNQTRRRRLVRQVGLGALTAAAIGGAIWWGWQERQEKRVAQEAAAAREKAAQVARGNKVFDTSAPPLQTAAAAAPATASAPLVAASSPPCDAYTIPCVQRQPGDGIAPVGLAGTGRGAGAGGSTQPPADPRDAPMLLAATGGAYAGATASPGAGPAPRSAPGAQDDMAQTQAQLRQLQQQALGALQQAQQRMASLNAPGMTPTALQSSGAGQMPGAGMPGAPGAAAGPAQAQAVEPIWARQMERPSLTIPSGTVFTCGLQTRVVTATEGKVKCITTRDLYGTDGKVVLAEAGSTLEGEYKVVAVRPGVTRIPVLWTRLRTPPPHNAVVDLDSPATGELGEAGVGGYVDNRWAERIGASLLLSLIDDAVKIAIANQTEGGGNGTVVFGGGTVQQGSKLAEAVLASTINIPPLLYRNQGTEVGVWVRSDLDFSRVYALRAAPAR